MRDEFDNTNKLIRLLRDGGLELVVHATEPRHEDTFLLGPDFAEQLLRKVKIGRVIPQREQIVKICFPGRGTSNALLNVLLGVLSSFRTHRRILNKWR